MGRRLLLVFGLVVAMASVGFVTAWILGAEPGRVLMVLLTESRPPILVGLLHSQTGPQAVSEKPVIDAETLAIEEINARGGLIGRRLESRIADGRSDPSTFAAEARRLIESDKVMVLFGVSFSTSRKAVIPVVEERGSLLFVPGNFEGMERSPRVYYAGGAANQTVVPAIRWAFDSLKARRFAVVGMQEVWSRSVSEIAKDSIKAAGAELAGEFYLPPGGTEIEAMVREIKASRPDVIISSVLGESNPPFYAFLHSEGLTADKVPVVSYSVSEDEVRSMRPADVAGHFSAWNYFQSLPRPENRDFLRRFKARFGEDRVVSDSMVSAYNAVLVWAQTVKELNTAEPSDVIEHLDRQSLNAPDSIVTIDAPSHVFWRGFHVGRARADGQFDIVWSIGKPIRPLSYVGSRSREQWQAFQNEIQASWGGRWSSTVNPLGRPLASEPISR